MSHTSFSTPITLAVALLLMTPSSPGSESASSQPRTREAGLRFEPNLGQSHARAAFLARGAGYNLALTPHEALFRLSPAATVRMKFVGANATAQLSGAEPFRGRSHYFRGRQPSAWVADVPNYRRVVGRDLYSGIDVVYYSQGRQLAFDFLVHPGALPDGIDLEFEGGELAVDAGGDVRVDTTSGALRIGHPSVFQERGGKRVAIPAGYERRGKNRVRFSVGAYDPSSALLIDPAISYSTYLGGAGDDYARAVAVGADGTAYVTGSTESIDFLSTSESSSRSDGASDAFVVKLSPAGEIIYSTFLGGSEIDRGEGIAVDATGAAFITGATSSSDFPTLNAFQSTSGGDYDAFMAKLDPTGSALQYSTYLGGSAFDSARGAAIDAQGNLITIGQTLSENFPTNHARQATPGGEVDAFVAKLNASGSGLVFSTFHGGSGNDLPFFHQGVSICGDQDEAPGWGVAIDPFGFIYVAGTTESTDFPLANALQAEHKGGLRDAFVSKFTPNGLSLVYSTYIGGEGGDSARGLAVDAFGNAYVTGGTKSADFPISAAAVKNTLMGDYDAFVFKLSSNGRWLLYSTFLGGVDGEGGNAIAVDRNGNAIFVGHTTSHDFPLLDSVGPTAPESTNLFLAKLNAFGSKIHYSTYLGGNAEEMPCGINMGIALDAVGSAYVAAGTASTDFPITAGAAQSTLVGGFDAFVTKLRTEPTIDVSIAPAGNQHRLVVTLGNPSFVVRRVELRLTIQSPLFGSVPVPLVPPPLFVSLPHMPPTAVIDAVFPPEVAFPGTTIVGKLIDPVTGLVLDESRCADSPCH